MPHAVIVMESSIFGNYGTFRAAELPVPCCLSVELGGLAGAQNCFMPDRHRAVHVAFWDNGWPRPHHKRMRCRVGHASLPFSPAL